MKSLLTKPSNDLPFYKSSQNSNLLYSAVDSLKRSYFESPLKKPIRDAVLVEIFNLYLCTYQVEMI
jgi:hypothetical protein